MSKFSAWLSSAMVARGATYGKVSEYALVSTGTVHNWLHDKTRPSYENCIKVAGYFGVDPNYVLQLAGYPVDRPAEPLGVTLPGAMDGMLIPYVEASAGGGLDYNGFTLVFPPPGASKRLALAHIRGDCMAPQIVDGDEVLIDMLGQWKNGQIVLARIDNDLLVKRAYRENSHVRLKADASGYADVVEQDLAIIGTVIEIRRKPR